MFSLKNKNKNKTQNFTSVQRVSLGTDPHSTDNIANTKIVGFK